MPKTGEQFERLIGILAKLRGPDGCPWDKEQTYEDINPYLLEETYEVLESIDRKDFEGLREELGDLLVHILFHSQLAGEEGKFGALEVVEGACEKLIRRHPHVFGEARLTTTKEVLIHWEKIKQTEKGKEKKESILEGLPKNLSALIQAYRLGEKTSRVGFDWKDLKGVLEKVHEELKELQESIFSADSRNREAIEKEFGDLLFTLANLGRFLKLDPETSLRKASFCFMRRFQSIEKKVKEEGLQLQDLGSDEWETHWARAKDES